MLADRVPPAGGRLTRAVSAALALIICCAGVITTASSASAADDLPTRLSLIIPISAPQQSTGLIPADRLELYTGQNGVLTRKLNAVDGKPVTIAIDPMIVASIRILGNTAPSSALEWLNRLADSRNETFALSYADSDISALSQAGTTEVLAPLWFQIDPELYPVEPEPAPTSTSPPSTLQPSGVGGFTSEPPTAETLTDWNYTLNSVLWPRKSSVTAADLVMFNSAGPVSTILSSANLTGPSRASVQIDDQSVLVTDELISSLFAQAATAPTVAGWQMAIDALLLELSDRTSITLAAIDRAVPDWAPRLAETIAAVTSNTTITMTDVATLTGQPRVTARIADEPVSADTVSRIRLMLAAEALIEPFSALVENPELLTGERRNSLLALASNSWTGSESVWSTLVDDWLAVSNTMVGSVQIAESSTLNFFQDRGNLPIAVSNDLPYPVTVYVSVRSSTGILVVTDSRVPVLVEAGARARASIPVQSIANGTATLRVSLTTEAGHPVGAPKTVTANVVAGWENTATLIIAALLIVMFIAGIVRTVLKRRRLKARDSLTNGAHE